MLFTGIASGVNFYFSPSTGGGAPSDALLRGEFADSLAARGFVNADTVGGPLATRYWVNSQGFLTSESGDITSVQAGDGLVGGGTSGDVTLSVAVDYNGGLEIQDDSLNIKLADSKLSLSSAGLTVNESALTLSNLSGQVTDAQVPDNITIDFADSARVVWLADSVKQVPTHTHTESDITDLSHYTTSDFNTDFATKTTDDLTEGSTNKYESTSVSGAGLDISSYVISLDLIPTTGNATLIEEEDALQVKYDTNDFTEDANGLNINDANWASQTELNAKLDKSAFGDSLANYLLDSLSNVNISSSSTGDLLYYNASGQWVNLPIGSTGLVLKVGASGVPEWGTDNTGGGGSSYADSLRTNDGTFDADIWLDSSGLIDTLGINTSQWNTYIQNHEVGDISSVIGGSGLSSGGSSGDVTLDVLVDYDGGLEIGDDSLNIKLADSKLSLSSSGLTVNEDALTLSNIGGSVTDAQVPDDITINYADSARAASVADSAVVVAESGIPSSITRDSEWDTAAEINAATTDEDFLTESTSFSGDVSGTYNAIQVIDDSHNHVISNIDYLQDSLNAKVAYSDTTNGPIATRTWVNSQGFLTSETGDISSVTAGNGLGGGGNSGDVTLDVLLDYDSGLEIGDDSLNIKLADSKLSLSFSGLTVNESALTLSNIGGSVTDAQVPDDITINFADSSRASAVADSAVVVSESGIPSSITRDTEWDTAAEINAVTTDEDFLTESTTFSGDVSGTYNSIVVADDSHNHVITNIDPFTETQLETQLSDVTNVYTNNDGSLSDDDLSDNVLTDLSDVSATTGSGNTVVLSSSPTITTPIITLEQSTSPSNTSEGRIQWDTDDDKIVVGDGSSTVTFTPDPSVIMKMLIPEYYSSVMDTLSEHGLNHYGRFETVEDSVNASTYYNCYKWTVPDSSTSQYYAIKVHWQVPSDFSSWDTNAIRIYYKTGLSGTTNNSIEVDIYESDTGTLVYDGSELSSTTWTSLVVTSTNLSSYFAANEIMRIIIKVKADNTTDAAVYVGRIQFRYVR
jgi:Tfp pilus assembly protein PilX